MRLKMNKAIEAALKEFNRINAKKHEWATFECNEFHVWIDRGHILSDGTKEIAIASIEFVEKSNGEVDRIVSVHT